MWISRILNAEERVSDPTDISVENVKTDTQRLKWVHKIRADHRMLYDTQCFNMQVVRVPEERRESRIANIVEEERLINWWKMSTHRSKVDENQAG